jgi:hypothetical protein
VPLVGIVTARLVAPGAMSPVSTLPSFRTTWCVTVSLFLNTTCCPPKAAGLGVNACAPFWPTIVIVGVAVDVVLAGDGAVVFEEDPLLPQADAAARPTIRTATRKTTRRIFCSSA